MNPPDVIVLGGGPAGSTTATLLARGGQSVLLVEKDFFPRFHIGESLLPYNRRIFDEMGLLPKLESAGFPKKRGAQFHLSNGKASARFRFREGRFTREHGAIQVERARFDHLLLEHARESGAEVWSGWAAHRFAAHPDKVTVEVSSESQRRTIEARFLVDATGRGNLTGNQERLRTVHPRLRKLAIFGHFSGVHLDSGEARGDTVIVRAPNCWFWIIPISDKKTSVGCVLDQAEFIRANDSPKAVFDQTCAASRVMRERLRDAKLLAPMQATGDFSYRNRRLTGPRLLRVGDAAGFLDPIFSSGVYLAMYSGQLAANTILKAQNHPRKMESLFNAYESRVRRAMDFYWEMVEQFYTTPFLELLFSPREKFQLASAVNAALAGELHGGWKLRWRLRLFFWLVRLQARHPFLPKLDWSSDPAGPTVP